MVSGTTLVRRLPLLHLHTYTHVCVLATILGHTPHRCVEVHWCHLQRVRLRQTRTHQHHPHHHHHHHHHQHHHHHHRPCVLFISTMIIMTTQMMREWWRK